MTKNSKKTLPPGSHGPLDFSDLAVVLEELATIKSMLRSYIQMHRTGQFRVCTCDQMRVHLHADDPIDPCCALHGNDNSELRAIDC